MIGPLTRILLRYGVGALASLEIGEALASDPDIVDVATLIATAIVGVVTELWYRWAKHTGKET